MKFFAVLLFVGASQAFLVRREAEAEADADAQYGAYGLGYSRLPAGLAHPGLRHFGYPALGNTHYGYPGYGYAGLGFARHGLAGLG